MIDAEDGARSLTTLPDDLRRKFIQAEEERTKREFWRLAVLIVAVAIAGITLIAWAIGQNQ